MPTTTLKQTCYHCGEECAENHLVADDKHFCCDGCQTVYQILNQNNLCNYYTLDQVAPGISGKQRVAPEKFAYLDNPDIAQKLVRFSDANQTHITLHIPHIHCSSCVWLLENLHRIEVGVLDSEVNFPKKEIKIIFDPQKTNLRRIADLLAAIGYEPHISLSDIAEQQNKTTNRSHLYKIGIAGFAFANIMLLSLPEYLSWGNLADTPQLAKIFSTLNLLLALPVFFYSASEFFVAAYQSIRYRYLNIDAPIALAILVTFGRSLYEIITQTGAGYMDSMTGIVFFMLIGRYFQRKTYDSLSFERDYKSYFPVAVTVKRPSSEIQVPVTQLKVGDKIILHNNELVPADALLYKGIGQIDYSFVTGEAVIIEKQAGELIYAGGKHTGSIIELEVVKEVSQSYLTQLWNNPNLSHNTQQHQAEQTFVEQINRYFTIAIFSIAALSTVYWLSMGNPHRAIAALTAVLIIACPCALLLSATFTYGNMLRWLGRNKFYVKNNAIIEKLAGVNTIVFDKTGTITQANAAQITYTGVEPNATEQQKIETLAAQSTHPLSRQIVQYLQQKNNKNAAKASKFVVQNYEEILGKGLKANIEGDTIYLGAAQFMPTQSNIEANANGTHVFVAINNEVLGYYSIANQYRHGLSTLIANLKPQYPLYLLSGDKDTEKTNLQTLFGTNTPLLFNQKPNEKLQFIAQLQQQGKQVLMLGDGLNDAGALLQSDVGIAVSDNINNFSPACDAILDGQHFDRLGQFIRFARSGRTIIRGSFAISVLYNIVGLSFAVQGTLQPVIAAILMPLSSISIVLFTTLASTWAAKRLGLG